MMKQNDPKYPFEVSVEDIIRIHLNDPVPSSRSVFKDMDMGENVLGIQKPFLDSEVAMILKQYTELCKIFENLKELARINVDLLYVCVDVNSIPDVKEEVDKVQKLIHTLINGCQACDIKIFCLEQDAREEVAEDLSIKQSALKEEDVTIQEYNNDNDCNGDGVDCHGDEEAVLPIDVSNETPTSENKPEKKRKSRQKAEKGECVNPKIRTCPICNKIFLGERGLRIHAHDKHGYIYKCTICSKEFERYNTFRNHQRNHESGKIGPKLCSICGEQFNGKNALSRHLEKHKVTKQSHTCDFCGRVFRFRHSMVAHRRHNHLRNKKVCPICGKMVSSANLYRHNRMHKGEKLHKCSFCPKTFIHGSRRDVHQRCHTKIYPHKCTHCYKGFNTPGLLRLHERKHASIEHPGGKTICEKASKCSACDRGFSSNIILASHVLSFHSRELDHCILCNDGKTYASVSDFESHLQSVHLSLKPFKCTLCEESFHTIYKLRSHKDSHKENGGLNCEDCGKKFITYRGLKLHRTNKHSTVPLDWTCEICGKRLSSITNLTRHRHIHSEEKPYKCLVCGSAFASRDAHRRHTWVHAKEKRFQCDKCAKGFNFRWKYLSHLETCNTGDLALSGSETKTFIRGSQRDFHQICHTDIYPYKCLHCNKGFNTPGLLRLHETVHTGIKHPGDENVRKKGFKCSACNRGFTTNIILASHVLSYHSRELDHCILCNDGKIYDSVSDFESHLQSVHLSLKPFKCTLCEESFHTIHKLRSHKVSHKENGGLNCEDCGKKFTTYRGFKVHRANKHSAVPLDCTCEVCGKRLSSPANLIRHRHIHSSEKPYKCLVCGSAFTTRDAHRTHSWVHVKEKRFRCDKCAKGFNHKWKYISHLKTCNPGDPALSGSEIKG